MARYNCKKDYQPTDPTLSRLCDRQHTCIFVWPKYLLVESPYSTLFMLVLLREQGHYNDKYLWSSSCGYDQKHLVSPANDCPIESMDESNCCSYCLGSLILINFSSESSSILSRFNWSWRFLCICFKNFSSSTNMFLYALKAIFYTFRSEIILTVINA